MRKKKSMAEGERGRGGEVTQTLETEEDYLDKIFFNFLKEMCHEMFYPLTHMDSVFKC